MFGVGFLFAFAPKFHFFAVFFCIFHILPIHDKRPSAVFSCQWRAFLLCFCEHSGPSFAFSAVHPFARSRISKL